MSGICAVWWEYDSSGIAGALSNACERLCFLGTERVQQKTDGRAGVAVAARFDTQQVCLWLGSRVQNVGTLARGVGSKHRSVIEMNCLTPYRTAWPLHALRVPPTCSYEPIFGLKLHGGSGKYIFKKSLEPVLLREILTRKNMGFSVPLAAWFNGELRELTYESILRHPDGILNDAFLTRCWDQHQRRQRDWSTLLWTSADV